MIFLNLCFVWILCYWSSLSQVIVMSHLQSHHEFSSVWGVFSPIIFFSLGSVTVYWLGNNWDLVLSHSDGTQVLTIYTTAAARSWAPQIQSWVCCIFFHKFFCEHFEDFETFQISKFWYLLLPNTESSHLVWPQIPFFPRSTLVPVSWQCPASDRLIFR